MSERVPRPALDKRAAYRLRRAKNQPGRWTRQRNDSDAARHWHAIQVITEAGGGDLPSGMLQLELQILEAVTQFQAVFNRRFLAITDVLNGDQA